MTEWLIFNGTAIAEESTYLLIAEGNNGRLRLAKENVDIADNAVRVRKGSNSELVKNPHTEDQASNFQIMSDSCSKWSCIGLIRRCCDNGRIEGVCIGVVGC